MDSGCPAEQCYNHYMILSSKEEKEYPVSPKAACMSKTIKSLVSYPEDDIKDWEPPSGPIPLPQVQSSILELVIKYCEYHIKNENETEDIKNTFNNKFVLNMDDNTLFNIISAANYLDIESLLDLCCKQVADYIKECKTPQEIRRRFNIKNDFTPEEEEEVKKENSWCEE
tara:strand:+ start:707 stop:1216 length:510 start_codon:yes stop_codon:yes gene_type:complete